MLDGRGYNMGIRLIDEFLAKAKITSCGDFRETADKIAKVRSCCMGPSACVLLLCQPWVCATSDILQMQQGFRTFLSTTATVDGWNAEGNECNLVCTCRCLL